MFNTIALRKLSNAVFLQFLKLVVDKLDEADPKKLKLKKGRDELADLLPGLTNALNLEIASAETKIIQALDQKRDDAIVGLQAIINGNTYNENEAIKAAADLLKTYLKSHGSNISRLNYQAETAVIDKIVEALKADARYAQAITTLGLGSWVANLENANKQFAITFKSRNTEFSANTSTLSFGELKKQSLPVYTKMVTLIESRFNTANEDGESTEPYQKLVNEINALIESFSTYVSKPEKGSESTPAPGTSAEPN